MTRISCLHTAASNIAIFAAEAASAGVALSHALRPDLLAAAERAGRPDAAILAETAAALASLAAAARGDDAVLLTCSTLGPAVALLRDPPIPVLRADAALAGAAARRPGRVAVLCAAPTTLGPTRAVFEAAFAEADPARLEVQLVEDAWTAFRAGEAARYLALVAAAADAAADRGMAVVLAQASMAPAAGLCRAGRDRPMTVPAAALAAVSSRSRPRPS